MVLIYMQKTVYVGVISESLANLSQLNDTMLYKEPTSFYRFLYFSILQYVYVIFSYAYVLYINFYSL